MSNIVKRTTLGIGDVVFVMQTDDVEAVHTRLRQWGARVQAPPHAFEVRRADGSWLRMTTLGFWDPDGYFFEINQRHAA